MTRPTADDVAGRQYWQEFKPFWFARSTKWDDTKIKLIGPQTGANFRKIAVALLENNVRVVVLKLSDHPTDHRIHKEGNTANPDETARTSQQALDCLGRTTAFDQYASAVGRKLHAERRGLKRPAVPHKERLADTCLQLGEGAGKGRLRKAECRRTLADAAGIDDGGKLDEMGFVQLHNEMVYWSSQLSSVDFVHSPSLSGAEGGAGHGRAARQFARS